MTLASTKNHALVGFENPFLVCGTCTKKVRYWHDPDRCRCLEAAYNHPCGHPLNVTSICSTWSSIDGCICTDKETHDK